MGKINEISQNLKQSFDGNDIDVNILQDKVVIDSNKKVIEINNTLRTTTLEINGVSSVPFTSAEKEKLNKFSTPMQVVGRVDSVELLPLTDVAIGSVYLVGIEGSADFEEYIVIGSNPTTYESLGKTQTHQVQSNWNQTTSTAADYIASKPSILAGAGTNSIVEGNLIENTAIGNYSHAEGYITTASGYYSHTEGFQTTASGISSHAEGNGTTASGNRSHAEGNGTIAMNLGSHAEGNGTAAGGEYSHAEGSSTSASGNQSHSEGYATTASGARSHAEGDSSKAIGERSHAEGNGTTASGEASHAEGNSTIAKNKSQHVFGEYNIADPSLSSGGSRGIYVEIVGKGVNGSFRSNARTLDWGGNEVLAGTITANGINISEAISTVKLRVNGGSLQASIDSGATWHTINFAN